MKYDDIINLEHYESKTRKRMSIENRAMQFAPFKALTGQDDLIKESSRFVDSKIILSEDEKNVLDDKLINLQNKVINLTYFIPDKLKKGGRYDDIKTSIKKIDYIKRIIVLNDNNKIKIDDIINIEEVRDE